MPLLARPLTDLPTLYAGAKTESEDAPQARGYRPMRQGKAEGVRGSSVFNHSLFTFDGYSMEDVKSINAKSTAFTFRDQNILAAPLITYMPDGAELDEKAAKLGNQLQQIPYEGSGREHVPVYVNYAYGDEGPKEWYGSESWRQSRLQSLRKKYDPNGMFSFYAPIA